MFTNNVFSLLDLFDYEPSAPAGIKYTTERKDDCYEISILAPGFNKSDFKLDFTNGSLLVTTKCEKPHPLVSKDLNAKFAVSYNVDGDRIRARYDAGILTVTLPIKENTKKGSTISVD